MSITPFLHNEAFDPDTLRLMSEMFERICGELGCERSGISAELVAAKMFQHVEDGVRSKTALYLATMADFKFSKRLPS